MPQPLQLTDNDFGELQTFAKTLIENAAAEDGSILAGVSVVLETENERAESVNSAEANDAQSQIHAVLKDAGVVCLIKLPELGTPENRAYSFADLFDVRLPIHIFKAYQNTTQLTRVLPAVIRAMVTPVDDDNSQPFFLVNSAGWTLGGDDGALVAKVAFDSKIQLTPPRGD